MISPRAIMQPAFLVVAAGLCILLSPPPPLFQRPLICARAQFIGTYAHVMVNCDAASFVDLAEHPSRVLEKKSIRQTRPGYALLGNLMSIPFHATSRLTGNPYYAGYVALNFLLLIAVLVMLRDLLAVQSLLAPSAIVPAALLLVNHITKAFLWTPHTQVMGLFVSMLAVWLARSFIVPAVPLTYRIAILAGLMSGAASLIYGAFLMIPATLVVVIWSVRGKETRDRISATLAIVVGAAVPILAWRAFVIAKTGSFYSHETAHYHEFVWIAEEWRSGQLATAFTRDAESFLATFPRALGIPIAFLAAQLALAWSRGTIDRKRWNDAAIRGSMAFLVVAILFYGLMGFYDPRLTAALLPPLVIMTGTFARCPDGEKRRAWLPEPITLAALAYAVLVIMIPGPYA